MPEKVILITGSRKGIGEYLSRYYLAQGHTVIGCSRGKSSIDHEQYRHFVADVTDEAMVLEMVHSIRREYGGVDVLINNAGVAAMNHLMMTPTKSARKVMEVNFIGTYLLTREVAKIMRKRGGGSIVNFTSVAVPLVLAGEAVYAASKAAIESFTQISAKELADFNIRVNAIGPTPIDTDLVKHVPEEKINNLLEQQIISRFGKFEDVSNVIDFFISDRSDFITGQVLYLGGVVR